MVESDYTGAMPEPLPLFLFTDFGWSGPYVGQLHVALQQEGAPLAVTDLMHDAPAMRPDLAAYLLPGVCQTLPRGVVLAVVDPGVGGSRAGVVADTGRLLFVGPDNGLFSQVPGVCSVARIDWRPANVAPTFHGRDIFAPVAARLARGEPVDCSPWSADQLVGADWPPACAKIIYIDGYGNAMTGIPAAGVTTDRELRVAGRRLPFAATFCEVPQGEAFWYRNSQGLIEIAVSGRSAAAVLGLALGDELLLD